MSILKEIESILMREAPVLNKATKEDYLSTGSTLLNIACTNRTDGGFVKGRYYRFVGDSASGKTFLSLTCLAEAAINLNFDDYQLIHDDAENGALFDFKKFFGRKLADRIMPPGGTREEPQYSETVEDFYDSLDDAMKRGPCIYIMDSMDVLVPRADMLKYQKQKASRKRAKEGTGKDDEAGSFGVAKAKLNSQLLRTAVPTLRRTKSILIVISQTHDKINQGFMPAWGDTKVGGGGHSLKFYAGLELWSSVKKKIMTTKEIGSKKRELGVEAIVRIKKNRQTGRDRSVTIPIYHSFGIDDVGANVDYLIEEGHWKKNGGKIFAKELDLRNNREQLIQAIIEQGKEGKVRKIVKEVWNSIEARCNIKRKSRYIDE